ncbi:MAG: pantoate--beta-alanine ligase [Candidatus Marinimicrobia bacterium]|nr:pantoate--beta-alanine ligase [Candidatus Neomarinimicrobiota bacterium]
MRIIRSVAEMQSYSNSLRSNGVNIGFVPTMGALHDGHLSLIRKSLESTDETIVSIFVNPTQFAPSEDLASYPRDFARDEDLARELGVKLIFNPSAEDIYPNGFSTFTVVKDLSDILEGESRASHFKGVTTIVNKFFNVINPKLAFFGQKDAQQALIIKKMVEDLNFDIKIIVCPTIRENDGLAMSSRNTYLSTEARSQAAIIYKSLRSAEKNHKNGEFDAVKLHQNILSEFKNADLATIDYAAIVDEKTLLPLKSTENGALIVIAVLFDKTRLIDNILLGAAV